VSHIGVISEQFVQFVCCGGREEIEKKIIWEEPVFIHIVELRTEKDSYSLESNH